MHVRLAKTFKFEAAHLLPSFPEGHKCRRLHGHSYEIDVIVEGDLPDGQSFLVDYGEIKAACAPIRDQLDHRYLNEIDGLEDPTAEMVAVWIWDRLAERLPLLSAVIVHETCTARCEYQGPEPKGV